MEKKEVWCNYESIEVMLKVSNETEDTGTKKTENEHGVTLLVSN